MIHKNSSSLHRKFGHLKIYIIWKKRPYKSDYTDQLIEQ